MFARVRVTSLQTQIITAAMYGPPQCTVGADEDEGGPRRTQEPRGARSQKEPGGARRSQVEPGGARGTQEDPGAARRSHQEPPGARRGSWICHVLSITCVVSETASWFTKMRAIEPPALLARAPPSRQAQTHMCIQRYHMTVFHLLAGTEGNFGCLLGSLRGLGTRES